MLSRLCSRRTVAPSVIHAEIAAVKQLDIPYFVGRTTSRFLLETASVPPAELIIALRNGP